MAKSKKQFNSDLLRDLHAEPLAPLPLETEPVELSALTHEEATRLADCEAIIHRGLKTFVEVGNALYEIRTYKLYRQQYRTFESYCQERWQLKRQRAYELMGAAEIANQLVADVSALAGPAAVRPDKEAHAAALAKIPARLRFQVWQKVVEDSVAQARPVTVRLIEEATATLVSQQETAEDGSSSTQQQQELLRQIRQKVAKARLEDVHVEISGKWLLKNRLVDVWRQLNPDLQETIDANYRAQITLYQAEKMGLIRKLK